MVATAELTDKAKIREAFKELRKLGYTARMNFMCCSSCAWYELGHKTIFGFQKEEERPIQKVVFYNRQNSSAFKAGSYYGRGGYATEQLQHGIYLQWSGNAEEIVAVLTKYELRVEWDGKDTGAIYLKGKDE